MTAPLLNRGGYPAPMAAPLSPAASRVPPQADSDMELDRLIQYMPLAVRETILSELIAGKINNKATIEWAITHRKIRGWDFVHEE